MKKRKQSKADTKAVSAIGSSVTSLLLLLPGSMVKWDFKERLWGRSGGAFGDACGEWLSKRKGRSLNTSHQGISGLAQDHSRRGTAEGHGCNTKETQIGCEILFSYPLHRKCCTNWEVSWKAFCFQCSSSHLVKWSQKLVCTAVPQRFAFISTKKGRKTEGLPLTVTNLLLLLFVHVCEWLLCTIFIPTVLQSFPGSSSHVSWSRSQTRDFP